MILFVSMRIGPLYKQMQCELPEVNSYQYVNPYEMTYKNMNFEINGSVSK